MRLGREGSQMRPLGEEIILNNFLYLLIGMEDAEFKYFGLKKRKLVRILKGKF